MVLVDIGVSSFTLPCFTDIEHVHDQLHSQLSSSRHPELLRLFAMVFMDLVGHHWYPPMCVQSGVGSLGRDARFRWKEEIIRRFNSSTACLPNSPQ
jgi:hypothetical protein